MFDTAKLSSKVAPVGVGIGNGDVGDWDPNPTTTTTTNNSTRINVRESDTELRQRKKRRKSVECGTDEYATYVERRVFNKRHAWTPYMWQRKRDIRKLAGLNPTKGWKGWKHRQRMRWNSLKITLREWRAHMEIWRDSLKRIEGYQGVGVVSYFVFLKFLLFLNVFVFLTMFVVVVFFQLAFSSKPYSRETTGQDQSANLANVILAENCTAQYKANLTYATSGFQVVLDFIQGTGWMSTTAFFYGYYGNTEVGLPGGTYNLPLAYFLATFCILVVSLLVMIHHLFSTYMDTLLISQTGRDRSKFMFSTLATWDYTICGAQPVTYQHRSFYHLFIAELEEYRHEQRKRGASTCSRCALWTVRIAVNAFIVLLLAASAAALYYAQTFSAKFTTEEGDSHHMIVVTFVQYLPSLVIVALNAGFPLLFMAIIKLERYRPSVVIKLTLLRIVFVRLAALIVVTITIYLKIQCSPSNECNVGTGSCPVIQCWEVYFGQQLYKFVVIEFLADVAVTLLYELPRKLVTTKLNVEILKKLGPAEFDIPINVLDLIYSQSLCWLGFYFAPCLPAACLLRLIALFFLRKLSALYNTVPAKKPYHAAKSNAFFMGVLMVAFFLSCIPLGFVLVELEPSRMCGPFRIYERPSEIITIQINIGAEWFKTMWTIITSSAFITVIVLLLSMMLYYCSALRAANKKTITALRQQLLQDEKDKQYLIAHLSRYTSEFVSEKKQIADKPKPSPAVTSVNETSHNPAKTQQNGEQIGKTLPNVPEKAGSPKGLVIQADEQNESATQLDPSPATRI